MKDNDQALASLSKRYLHFAEFEARNVSPIYEELARAAADSTFILRFIASLPQAKQQPNLVLAAIRHLFGPPKDGQQFLHIVEEHAEPIRHLVLRRSTQTNEPARCATLLPLLGRLPQPLALIEVGASAGLCLLPDYYGYDYQCDGNDDHIVQRTPVRPDGSGKQESPDFPVFPCQVNEATPIPGAIPRVVFRAGLDLNPIDAADPQEAEWLESLVWPGQEPRATRLRAAIAIAVAVARQHPVNVVKGDLLTDLPALAARAPKDATLVVFHSAVLAYVAAEERERFAEVALGLGGTWISNEAAGVFPWIAAKRDTTHPPDRFLLSVNGEPVAATGPHGQSVDWFT
ncbi:MAG: DUF2332 domain-containing protein [Armatimonadota bacterium]